jgi:hypothetical protein
LRTSSFAHAHRARANPKEIFMGRYSNAGVPAKRAAQPQADDSTEDFRERIAGQARKLVDDEIGARFGRGASDLNRLSDALRGAGARLEGSFAGSYFERAAGQLDQVAQMLQHTSSRELVDGVQRFARERPLLFLGSAVALGIGAGRFLRSSSTSSGTPLLSSGNSTASGTTTPSARRAARNKNREASQTRGTSHE